jgi:hypothetical protein
MHQDLRKEQVWCLRSQVHDRLVMLIFSYPPCSVNTLAVGCDDSSIKLYDLRAIGKLGKYKEESSFESV